jgi:predicted glycogen debranching enzyme
MNAAVGIAPRPLVNAVDLPCTQRLERDTLGDFSSLAAREWLVTNGLGGYASGTLAGACTRRYHGLLVAALSPPLGRTVMVAKLDLFAQYQGHRIALGSNEYEGGVVAPDGHRQLLSFHLEGQTPVWTWLIGDARLEQRVWMEHGQNTTYVSWHLLQARAVVELAVHPLCTWRDYHWHHRGRRDPALQLTGATLELRAFDGAAPLRIHAEDATAELAPDWYWNFHHRAEAERGLDSGEDLFRPAVFHFTLRPGETRALVLTSERQLPAAAAASLERERLRQRGLLRDAVRSAPVLATPAGSRVLPLVLAADQFLVARHHADGRPAGRTMIAGYPWFGDWGRDTMIALPGLALCTGRAREAADILRTFAAHVSEGMLPNRFPDDGEAPEYNTVDATLWYCVAVHATLQRTADDALRRELYPVLQDILAWHLRGTRYGIGADPADGLLRAGAPGVQLTWMDAKIGEWVVTPRTGKPVEINALWVNALHLVAEIAGDCGDMPAALRYRALAGTAAASFRRKFWNEAAQCLYDVIELPDGGVDASLRPNQLFALSLPVPLLDGPRAHAVIDACLRELWTPVGLRSLAPSGAQYTGRYAGGPRERDAAYHQGTAWSWLLGPFALAHYRVHGDRSAAIGLLSGVLPHLREACIGQISEIFDGDAPFAAAGCFAQAWSVAETLRAWSEIHEREPEAR